MKPNFALSLSPDGIQVLHRRATGWRLLGDVDIEAADLGVQLALLRDKAIALAPDGLHTKIVVPNEQIRFLRLDTMSGDTNDKRLAALDALEDATPYAITELAYDITETGDETIVAAVTLETLAEAEAFATEHNFQPVSFVATLEDDTVGHEFFFGETTSAHSWIATGDTVEPDNKPIAVVDDAQWAKTAGPTLEMTTPDFVSRRRVPTFRTETDAENLPDDMPQDETGLGFSDSAAPFETAKKPTQPKPPMPAPAPVSTRPNTEADRLTVFGARAGARLTGSFGSFGVVTAVLVVILAGVGAFASGAGLGLTSFFDRMASPQPAAQFSAPLQPTAPVGTATQPPVVTPIDLASFTRELSDEDAAVLDALREPILAEPQAPLPPTVDEERAAYAASGIWTTAPEVPSPPALVDLEDLYVTGIDPISINFDAVALPALKTTNVDVSFSKPASPAPAGTQFTLDENGLVVPTRQGSMNPDGIMIFAGPPPRRQPDDLLRVEDPGEDLAMRLVLAGFRPQERPENLIETSERATLDGLTRSELALFRPRLRPQSAQETAQETARASASLVQLDGTTGNPLLQSQNENAFDGATARAVAASLRPDARPNNFSAIVARTRQNAPAATAASTARVAPRAITPNIPSSASATREATVKDAINLRRVNLIGVYGKPSSRRALVRMKNGNYRKVQVGDRIDGGRVSAIGDAELRYQKSGRAIVLKMPNG